MLKKIFCILLSLFMLSSVLVSCVKTKDEPVSTTVATSGVVEEDIDPKLEAEDFGGTFSILGREATDYSFPYFELSGNSSKSDLDSKIFERNMYIQQKYGIQLLSHYAPLNQLLSKATTDVLSGTDYEYDTYLVPTNTGFQMASNGLLTALDDIPYINLDKPYYDQSLKQDTSIANTHYFAHGHFSISTYNAVGALYLNKTMLDNYDLEDPYALVKNGTWTWEKMLEMCKNTTVIDENGETNAGQYQYGIAIGIYAWQPLFFGTGSSLVVKDSNDMPQLNLNNCMDIIQKINSVMNDPSTTFFPSSYNVTARYNAMEIFQAGRSLFMSDPLYCVPEYLIKSNIDYGILPLPKYTDDQTNYISQTHPTHSTVIAVPKVNPDLNKTGKIIEDYTYQSSLTVHPMIMDTMIKLRNAQSENDYDMLEIMFSGVRCDMGLAMSNELKIDGDVRTLIRSNSTTIASTIAGNQETYQAAMDKIVNAWQS